MTNYTANPGSYLEKLSTTFKSLSSETIQELEKQSPEIIASVKEILEVLTKD